MRAVLVTGILAVALAGCGETKSPAAVSKTSAPPTATATPAPTPTSTLPPLPSAISLPAGAAAPFAVDGDTVLFVEVASQGACPRYQLEEADLRMFHPFTIWTSPPCFPVNEVSVSRQWIVWETGPDAGGVIWARDRSKHRTYRVAMQPFNPSDPPCPSQECTPALTFSLLGGRLLWSHFTTGQQPQWMRSEILSRVLPSGKSTTVFVSKGRCRMQVNPSAGGSIAVWLQWQWPRRLGECEGGLLTDVQKIGSSGGVSRLTKPGTMLDPQTNGTSIAWLASPLGDACTCYRLRLMTRPGGSVKAVASAVTSYWLASRFLLYLQGSPTRTQLHMLDLKTHSNRVLASAGPPAGRTFLRAFAASEEGRVIWEKDTVRGPQSTAVTLGVAQEP